MPWVPYKHDFAVNLITSIYGGDGGTVSLVSVSLKTSLQSYCTILRIFSLTNIIQDIRSAIKESGEPVIPNISEFVEDNPKTDINALWDIQTEKWKYQTEYLEQFRIAEQKLGKEIDAIIAPIAPHAAVRHNQYNYYGYSFAINLLDFTSVVVPVTFADKEVDIKDKDFKAISDLDQLVQDECE